MKLHYLMIEVKMTWFSRLSGAFIAFVVDIPTPPLELDNHGLIDQVNQEGLRVDGNRLSVHLLPLLRCEGCCDGGRCHHCCCPIFPLPPLRYSAWHSAPRHALSRHRIVRNIDRYVGVHIILGLEMMNHGKLLRGCRNYFFINWHLICGCKFDWAPIPLGSKKYLLTFIS